MSENFIVITGGPGAGKTTLLDRLRRHGFRPTPPHFAAAGQFRYRRRVFVAPPWPEIYVNDTERKQDFAEAVRSYDAYRSCGYDLVTLPKSTVDERVAFVLDRLR